MAIPPDMQKWLSRKYNIMQQEADARTAAATADARLTGVRADLMPAQTASAGALANASIASMNAQTALAPLELASQDRVRRQAIADQQSQTFARDVATGQSQYLTPGAIQAERERRLNAVQGRFDGLGMAIGDWWNNVRGGMLY